MKLRTVELEDAKSLFTYFHDPREYPHVAMKPHQSLEDTRAYLERIIKGVEEGKWLCYVIATNEGQVAGTISLWNFDEKNRAELGVGLSSAYRKKGLMTRAIRELLYIGFEEKELSAIRAYTAIDNTEAKNLFIRTGFSTLKEIVEGGQVMVVFELGRLAYYEKERWVGHEYLAHGTPRQRKAYKLLKDYICPQLYAYQPVLAGTIPIDLDLRESDLDILCYGQDFMQLEKDLEFFSSYENFTLVKTEKYLQCNFALEGQEVELYAEDRPGFRQQAFRHMVMEYQLLEAFPASKPYLLALKRGGYTTEESFGKFFGVKGDPYQALLEMSLQDALPLPVAIRSIKAQDTWPIRHEVMWPNEALDMVILERDDILEHLGLFWQESLIGVISYDLLQESIQFRKFAVLPEFQGRGLGALLLGFLLLQLEKKEPRKSIWCNARLDQVPFYKQFGLEETGRTFQRKHQKYEIMELKYD